MAPEGMVCVVGDLSQIEARVLAWLAGYDELLDIFRSGQDAYALFGAQMFGVPGLTKESHPDLRQGAKGALLGCGVGLSWANFGSQLLTGFLGAAPIRYDMDFAKKLGVRRDDLQAFINHTDFNDQPDWLPRALSIPRSCTDEEIVVHCVAAQAIVDKYRAAARPVVKLWKLFDDAIPNVLAGEGELDYKCLRFKQGHIFLPNGMAIRYPELSYSKGPEFKGWSFAQGPKRKKLYGSAAVENAVQALASIVMSDGMLRIQKRYPVVLTVHDECCVLAPESEAEEAKTWVLEQMTMEPSYMPGIPLAAEGGYAVRYGDSKK
jgi:DNA polymerase